MKISLHFNHLDSMLRVKTFKPIDLLPFLTYAFCMYIRKQKPVEAKRLLKDNHIEIMEWLEYDYAGSPKDWEGESMLIKTINGNASANPGDWIVRETLDDGNILSHVYNNEAFREMFEPYI